MLAAISFPSWLSPEVIPGLPFRWYGIFYVVALALTWSLFLYESRRRKASWTQVEARSFFIWASIGGLLGARLFGTLVYDWATYSRQPWYILWPFDIATGGFRGYAGMSFHGGVLGLIVATLIYARRRGLSWLALADVLAVSAPLGYALGRLGNFVNGELWGTVSDRPWAMIFPGAPSFSAREPWVQEFANKVGIPVNSMLDLVNLPRHPTQLYEALFAGLLLWAALWLLVRKRTAFPGLAVGCYAIGLGAIRFGIEYFQAPDARLGYVLSAVMVLGGAAFLILIRKPRKDQGPARPL